MIDAGGEPSDTRRLRVLVVDSSEADRRATCETLKQLGVPVVGEARSVEDATAALASGGVDALLLETDIAHEDGLALARLVRPFPVVFVSHRHDLALDAFDVDAVDFVSKPVRPERIRRALERALRISRSGTRDEAPLLRFSERGRAYWVDARELTRLVADRKYVSARVEGREFLTARSLDELELELRPHGFARVHRGELIALRTIRRLEKKGSAAVAKLADGSEARVSRRYLAETRRALTDLNLGTPPSRQRPPPEGGLDGAFASWELSVASQPFHRDHGQDVWPSRRARLIGSADAGMTSSTGAAEAQQHLFVCQFVRNGSSKDFGRLRSILRGLPGRALRHQAVVVLGSEMMIPDGVERAEILRTMTLLVRGKPLEWIVVIKGEGGLAALKRRFATALLDALGSSSTRVFRCLAEAVPEVRRRLGPGFDQHSQECLLRWSEAVRNAHVSQRAVTAAEGRRSS